MPYTLESYSDARLQPAQYPQDARWTAGRFGPSLTLARGTVLGKKTADGLLYAYANANSDGTETAVGILMYDVVTDASSNVFFGDNATASSLNKPQQTAPYFISGVFDPADITGEDAAALTDLKAVTLANGFIRIP